ncbi:MAG: SGNH/GDSL hydrolase family protein, partial [Candidatus Brocadiales bacterium]|nr:SGNH/GDSL hydrolase family protein [Candidatus Bathyanammoxibius sp.]
MENTINAEPKPKFHQTVFSWLLIAVFSFIAAEVVLRLLNVVTPIYDVEMMRYAKALKVRSNIENVYHQHRSDASETLMGVNVSLNSLGHRSKELVSPKPANEKRIHVIGSSISLGWGIPVEGTFTNVMARMLNETLSPRTGDKYVGINAGTGNYNTFYQVEHLKSQINQTNPDVVVVQYYINDAESAPEGTDSFIFRYSYFLALVRLQVRSLLSVRGTSLGDYYKALYTDDSDSWRQTRASVKELAELCRQRGVKLVILIVPDLHDLSPGNPFFPLYRIATDYFKKLDISIVDPTDAIRVIFGERPTNAWVAPKDPHPNAKVHEIMGRELGAYLSTAVF